MVCRQRLWGQLSRRLCVAQPFLIGFGGLTEDEIRDGLERLAAAMLIEKYCDF